MKIKQVGLSDLVSRVGERPAPRRASFTALLLVISLLLIVLTSCASPLASTGTPMVQRITPTPTSTPLPTATPDPLPTATPDPLQAAKARVLQIMAGVSLQQKLGQLVLGGYTGNNYTEISFHNYL